MCWFQIFGLSMGCFNCRHDFAGACRHLFDAKLSGEFPAAIGGRLDELIIL